MASGPRVLPEQTPTAALSPGCLGPTSLKTLGSQHCLQVPCACWPRTASLCDNSAGASCPHCSTALENPFSSTQKPGATADSEGSRPQPEPRTADRRCRKAGAVVLRRSFSLSDPALL